jgi:hypothetical protein
MISIKNLHKFLSTTLIGLILGISISANAQNKPVVLKYFGGAITAQLTWLLEPTTVKNEARLRIDLIDSHNKPHDIDPTLISAGLFMPSMPDMGVTEQDVVATVDAGGHAIAGSYSINRMKFSMRGGWDLLLTLPNPTDENKTETQKLSLKIQ